MNIQAGTILIHLNEVDGVTIAIARVLLHGNDVARFEVPLAPELRDIRDDVATIASRAADAMVALVRNVETYPPRGELTPEHMAAILVRLATVATDGALDPAPSSAETEAAVTFIGNVVVTDNEPHRFKRCTSGRFNGPPDETCELCGFDPRNTIHLGWHEATRALYP